MTRLDLRTLVLAWLDDVDGGYFTPSIVNTWLNLAQRSVQKRLLKAGQNFYERPVETTTIVNQADYVFPVNFMKLHRLEIILSGSGITEDAQSVLPITLNQKDYFGSGTGTPAFYSISKNRMTLYPTPSQAWKLRLYMSSMVDDMSDDANEPDVPEEYHEYVGIIAAMNGFIKDDRAPSTLLEKKREYETEIDETANDRLEDTPRMIRMTDEDNSGSDW